MKDSNPDSIRTLLGLLNSVYNITPRPGTKTTPDLVAARFKSLTPQRRSLVCKALKSEPGVPQFQVFGMLKAKDDGPRPTVDAVLSTSAPDLEGDRMSEKAIRQMVEGFKGLTIFLNHHYSWPEDVFGTAQSTSLVRRASHLAVAGEIRVATNNPRAMQAYQLIKSGVRAGVSVGVIVLSYHEEAPATRAGKRTIVLDEVLPLEASICGIPANQGSWVEAAKSALSKRT